MSFRLATALVALPLFAAATAPASASIGDIAPPTHQVHYGDLRLDTPEGKRTLSRRVRYAARAVCPEPISALDAAVTACRAEAKARAMADLGRAGIAL